MGTLETILGENESSTVVNQESYSKPQIEIFELEMEGNILADSGADSDGYGDGGRYGR